MNSSNISFESLSIALESFDDAISLLDTAEEGAGLEATRMSFDKRFKKLRLMGKLNKYLLRCRMYDELSKNISSARKLVDELKKDIHDNVSEPAGFFQKLATGFAPIFTWMPSSEIESVTYVGNNTFVTTYRYYEDEYSKITKNAGKVTLQQTLNLYNKQLNDVINTMKADKRAMEDLKKKNLNKYEKLTTKYELAKEKYKSKINSLKDKINSL